VQIWLRHLHLQPSPARPVFRGGVTAVETPPPRKVYKKCHEHGSYRPSWSKTCSRMHQNAPFRRRKYQNFSTPPPDHISGYGPVASQRVIIQHTWHCISRRHTINTRLNLVRLSQTDRNLIKFCWRYTHDGTKPNPLRNEKIWTRPEPVRPDLIHPKYIILLYTYVWIIWSGLMLRNC